MSLACATALVAALSAGAGVVDAPQRLSYRIAWNGIPAASATVRVHATDVEGKTVYVVAAEARTNAFVDIFWPFRGRVAARLSAADLQPLHFDYQRTIRGVPSRTRIDFDPTARSAASTYVKRGKLAKRLHLAGEEVVDPITAIFQARHGDTAVGTEQAFDVFTGESRYRVELEIIGEDDVTVPAGRFAALRVEPRVWKVRGPDEPRDRRLRHAILWVTRDASRTLLRIRSEVFVGAVTLDLLARGEEGS